MEPELEFTMRMGIFPAKDMDLFVESLDHHREVALAKGDSVVPSRLLVYSYAVMNEPS